MSEYVLEMTGVTKRFPGVLALNDATFTLRPGEVHCLVGENGAGKSTLVKILAGAETMDSGEIRLFGSPVHIQSPHHAQQLGVSMIYQEFNLSPFLSIAENIFLGREPRLGKTPFINWRAHCGAMRGRYSIASASRQTFGSASTNAASPNSKWWKSRKPCPLIPRSS